MLYEIYILRLPTAYCYNDGKEIKRWWARGLSRLMPLIFPNYHKVAVPPQTFTFRVSHNLTFENIRSLIPARQNFMFVDRALCNVSQLQEIVIFQKKFLKVKFLQTSESNIMSQSTFSYKKYQRYLS